MQNSEKDLDVVLVKCVADMKTILSQFPCRKKLFYKIKIGRKFLELSIIGFNLHATTKKLIKRRQYFKFNNKI